MFDLHAIEKGGSPDKMSIFTLQATTEEDFEEWVAITGGQIDVSKPQLSSKTEMQSRNFCNKNNHNNKNNELFFFD